MVSASDRRRRWVPCGSGLSVLGGWAFRWSSGSLPPGTSWWCTRAGPEAAADLDRLGVRSTSELAEAAAGADVLLLCVFSDEQLAEVAEPLAAALPDGAVFASHVTGRASVLRSLADRFPRSTWWTRRSAAARTTSGPAA